MPRLEVKAVSRRADLPTMSLEARTKLPRLESTAHKLSGGSSVATCGRVYEWLASSRSHRVLCLLVGIWIINAFDVVLTLTAHRDGLLQESNPIAAKLLVYSPTSVVVFKLLLVGFSSVVLVAYRRRFLAEIAAGGILFVYTVVAIQWRLCYEVYALTRSSNFSQRALDSIDLSHILRTSWLFSG